MPAYENLPNSILQGSGGDRSNYPREHDMRSGADRLAEHGTEPKPSARNINQFLRRWRARRDAEPGRNDEADDGDGQA